MSTTIINIFKYLNILCNRYNNPLFTDDPNQLFWQWYISENKSKKERRLYVPEIYKNTKFSSRFIIFPILLMGANSLHFPENTKLEDNNVSHLIIFIYDQKTKNLEYFDSKNSIYEYDSLYIKKAVINIIKKEFSLQIKKLYNFNIKMNIQIKQEKEVINNKIKPIIGYNIGLCSIYVVWYIERRLSLYKENPHKMFNKNDKLTEMIMEYTKYLENLVKNETEKTIDKIW